MANGEPLVTNFDTGPSLVENFYDDNAGGGGGGGAIGSQIVVPDFGGDSAQNVPTINHGNFWPALTNLGNFFWEAWCAPRMTGAGNGDRYVISDGFGGAHALLFGFKRQTDADLAYPQGNVWTGVATTSIEGNDGAGILEWCHVAYGWDGANLYIWLNGVLCSQRAFAGPRQSPAILAGGGGDLLIGGSDHNNFNGRIKAIRGFEGDPLGTNFFPLLFPMQAFVPEWNFRTQSFIQGTGAFNDCQFLADYAGGPRYIHPDLSPLGYLGKLHAGQLWGAVNGVDRGMPSNNLPSWPTPVYVIDPSAPFNLDKEPTWPTGPALTPPATPVGARIFDSFSRAHNLRAFQGNAVTLGSTESGSLGPLPWTTFAVPGGPKATAFMGVLSGRAVYLEPNQFGGSFVDNGQADMDVRLDRRTLTGDPATAGVVYRYQDSGNFRFAMIWREPGFDHIRIGMWVAGFEAFIDGAVGFTDFLAPNQTWTTMRVTCAANTITVYVDDGAGGWTQIGQKLAQTTFNAATKAGMFAYTTTGTAALTSGMRYDNFTVI